MDKKWIKYLADPETGNKLDVEVIKTAGEEIIEGALKTGSRKYTVTRGIPRFVPESLYEEKSSAESLAEQTSKSFGQKWRHEGYRELGESSADGDALKEQFLAMLGVKKEKDLQDIFQDGANSLNAGCGVAWSEYLFNVNKKTNRFAVDYSLAVETAYEKTKGLNNVFVAQADILNLPFRENFFDIIFSDGVLHHTGDARRSFDNLCALLKKGGLIGIYIYNIKPFLRELADEHVRKITTKMNFEDCFEFSKKLADLGKQLQKYDKPLEIKEDIEELGIKKGKYNLQKFIYDHFLKCFYNREFDFKQSALCNLDWYHPANATHHSKEEILSWFKENGIENPNFIQPPGWEYSGYFVSGRKK